jgi:hypothetical protein
MKLVVAVMITRMIIKIFDTNKTKKEVSQTKVNAAIKDPAAFNLR